MTDRKRSAQDWSDLWGTTAQEYFDAWSDCYGRLAGGKDASAGTNPWQAALANWWQHASVQLPEQNREIFERFVTQTYEFLRLADVLQATDAPGTDSAKREDPLSDLADLLQRRFTEFAAAALPPFGPFGGLAPPKDMGSRIWQKPEAFEQWLKAFESISPIGMTRERLQDARDGKRLLEAYRESVSDYLEVFRHIGVAAIERMTAQLQATPGGSAEQGGAKALYRLWVDCCEAAYAEHVLTDDYAARFGRLLNAALALRKFFQSSMDQILTEQNLPSRAEVDALHRRIHVLERAIAAGKVTQSKTTRTQKAEKTDRKVVRPRSSRKRRAAPSNWDIDTLMDADSGPDAEH